MPQHLRMLGGQGGDIPHRRGSMHPALRLRQIDTGRPQPLDTSEPVKVAQTVAQMGLRYATVTGVARDDPPDQGAWLYAQTVREIHAAVAGCGSRC